MNSNQFQIPEFGISKELDAHITKKLAEVAGTIKGENSFFRRVEYQDILAEVNLFFVEGKVQREFNKSIADGKKNAGARTLEWHFYAYFSRAFRNRMEDIYPSQYSTVKSARIRSGDSEEISSRKAYAAGVAPNVSLDENLASSGTSGSSKSTVHDIFGAESTEDLSTTVDRMRTLKTLEADHPVLYARLLDSVKNPSDVTSANGKSLSYKQRIEAAIFALHKLIGDDPGIPGDEFEDLEITLIEMMKGWRAVRGNYQKATSNEHRPLS